jgi:hypothetical protein
MEFLKKHYEKLILSVVLLGLAAVAATLPMKVNSEKQKEEDRKNSLIGAKVQPFPPVDLSTNQTVLDKVKRPIKFDIAGKHNLFNPVPWVEKPGGELVKIQGGNMGISALQVTSIHPLNMVMTLDDVIPTTGANGTNEYKYQVTVIREGAASNAKQGRAMSPGLTAAGIGTLKEVQGPPDNPTALVIELPDRTRVSISKEKRYSRIIGYAADLVCELPPLTKKDAKVGDRIQIGADVYAINSVDTNSVVLRDSRQKQYIKELNPNNPVANLK